MAEGAQSMEGRQHVNLGYYIPMDSPAQLELWDLGSWELHASTQQLAGG